jgi:hypothetical protein
MSKIRRRYVNTDLLGRILSMRQEDLTDNGEGIEETYVTAVGRCEACDRPLKDADEIRSRCVHCGLATCSRCEGRCAVCQTPCCGHCRAGFAEKPLSVCIRCLGQLESRLKRQDSLVGDKLESEREKVEFDRAMAVIGLRLKLLDMLQHGSAAPSWMVHLGQMLLVQKVKQLERNHERRRLQP